MLSPLMNAIARIREVAGDLYAAENVGGLSKSEISYPGGSTNRLLDRLGSAAHRPMSHQDLLKHRKFNAIIAKAKSDFAAKEKARPSNQPEPETEMAKKPTAQPVASG
ncbi:MAG TPA: hypothetical protein VHW70_14165 [Edaphobacter sp.]|nr:hypothetical protein [Edaphobacter sp.]